MEIVSHQLYYFRAHCMCVWCGLCDLHLPNTTLFPSNVDSRYRNLESFSSFKASTSSCLLRSLIPSLSFAALYFHPCSRSALIPFSHSFTNPFDRGT